MRTVPSSLCFLAGAACLLLSGCRSNSPANVVSAGSSQTSSSSGDAGPLTMNATFQSRNPRPCPSVQQKPTDSEAAALVQCTQDSIARDHIFLLQNVAVSVGTSSAEQPYDDQNDIDASKPVYALAGNEMMYSCDIVDNVMNNSGKNCNAVPSNQMTGLCYSNRGGDYRCRLGGGARANMTPGLAPPTAY